MGSPHHGWHGLAADFPPRAGTVPEVLPRWPLDCLHRSVWRRGAGLCHSLIRWRARPADLVSILGPAAAALGLRQSGLWLDARWQVGAVPLAARCLGFIERASVHR